MTKNEILIDVLNKFGMNAVPLSEWDGSTGDGAWIKNSEEAEWNGVKIFNSDADYFDPNEEIWEMGILKDINNVVEDLGFYFEAYDAGTYLVYPV